jgi:hypothetical protein
MDTNTTAADFGAVYNDVVCLRADVARVGFKLAQVLFYWRSERMVQ